MSEDEFLEALNSIDTHVMTIRRLLGEAKVRGAVEAVEDYLDGCTRKALVFAHHTSVIDGMMKGLADHNPVRIDGRDNPKAREKAIETFLTDDRCRVFVGQIQAAGTTITLVGPQCDVSDVFFVESSFSPGDNVQAASRIHRIGQKNAVQVWFFTAHGTFDDRINDIVSRKARDFKVLFD
jgi:SWI/SNF-related matrix-associated actin-dependent regulator of chromatin subfamily A-like protein 1